MTKLRGKIISKAWILASVALLFAPSFGRADTLSNEPETIVLFGDSITARWPWYLPDYQIINEGVDGNTILDLLDRMDPVIAHQPDTLFLLIGVNDILTGYYGEHSQQDNDAFMETAQQDYENLLDAIQSGCPNTHIYVQTILPTAWTDKNTAIEAFNSFVAQACIERGLTLIDLHSLFADEYGELKREFSLDGLHLTDEGYLFWVNEVMPRVLTEGELRIKNGELVD